MQIESNEDGSCVVYAPAKLNLHLEILGKREDGFHEIETVMCPISLTDRLQVRRSAGDRISLDVRVPNRDQLSSASAGDKASRDPAWDIPSNQDNLVHRAAALTRRRLGIRNGFHIELEKHIPAAAGLGGGSSDAAAVVVACMCLSGVWNREIATSVCAELGSDIPFFLGDKDQIGLALARGRGEECELLSNSPALEFLVTHPPVGCSTREVYAGYAKQKATQSTAKIISACQAGQCRKIGAALFNALQSSARTSNEWIDRQLNFLAELGLEFTLMSGSGSSCFALLEDEPKGKPFAESDDTIEKLRAQARAKGLERVYRVSAWYAQSIERQLDLITGRPSTS